METRFRALRIVGVVYKVIAVIVALLTALAVLAICGGGVLRGAAATDLGRDIGLNLLGSTAGALVFSVFAILYGGGLSVTLYAAGDFIDLLIALEENTRATARYLQSGQVTPPVLRS